MLFEPTEGLAHRLERLLHFFWLTDKIRRLAAKEPMIQQATSPRRQSDDIEGAVAWHQLLIQVPHLHQVRHHLCVGFAQVRAVSDQPQFLFWRLLQLLDRYLPQALGQMLCIQLRALRARSGRQPDHPLRPFLALA